MKKLILSIIILMIFLFACDRFDHDFSLGPEQGSIKNFFNDFEGKIINLQEDNLVDIMNFYHDDYNNDGSTKDDVQEYYQSILEMDDIANVEVNLLDTLNSEITWNLNIEFASETTPIDTTFTDILTQQDNSYKFYGNQMGISKVLVELFTAQWCPNCPKAEEALHQLKEEYGNRFSYIEYHIPNDPTGTIANQELMINDYGFYSPPIAIIQGQNAVEGAPSVEDVKAQIKEFTDNQFEQEHVLELKNLQISLEVDQLQASVDLAILNENEIHESAKLCIALLDETNNEVTNSEGLPIHNVSLLREVKDAELVNGQISVTVEDINSKLPEAYNSIEEIEDLKVLVWIQNIDFENDNSKIYYKIETNVN